MKGEADQTAKEREELVLLLDFRAPLYMSALSPPLCSTPPNTLVGFAKRERIGSTTQTNKTHHKGLYKQTKNQSKVSWALKN